MEILFPLFWPYPMKRNIFRSITKPMKEKYCKVPQSFARCTVWSVDLAKQLKWIWRLCTLHSNSDRLYLKQLHLYNSLSAIADSSI